MLSKLVCSFFKDRNLSSECECLWLRHRPIAETFGQSLAVKVFGYDVRATADTGHGNELQDEAFGKLYSYESRVRNCKNPEILKDWLYLQTSNHFYYMCTKWFSAGEVHKFFNPYGSPYEAFINYMNVLSDFMIRVDEGCKAEISVKTADEPAKPAKQEKKAKIQPEKIARQVKETKILPEKPVKDKTGKSKSSPEKVVKKVAKKVSTPAKVVKKGK